MEPDPKDLKGEPEKVEEEVKDTVRYSVLEVVASMRAAGAMPASLEELTTTVEATVQAVLAAAPPPPPMRLIQQPAAAAMFAPPAGVQPGADSFYPAADATARGILSLVGANTDIVTVPDFFNLQPGNPAITLKDDGTVSLYHAAIDQCAAQFPGLDVPGLKLRVVVNTILVKMSCVQSGQPDASGIIWHEHGHVLHGKSESGSVFAYEVDQIDVHLGRETAQWWVVMKRGIGYLASFASSSGIGTLTGVLKRVLSPEDFATFAHKLEHRGDRPSARRRVIGLGDVITGTLEELRALIGRDAERSEIPTGTKKDDVIQFGNIKWQVVDVGNNGGEPTYELKRMG